MVTKSSQNDATRYTSYSAIAARVQQAWSDGAGNISVYIDHADIQNVRMEICEVVAVYVDPADIQNGRMEACAPTKISEVVAVIHTTRVNALKLADALTAAASRLLSEQQEVKSDAKNG